MNLLQHLESRNSYESKTVAVEKALVQLTNDMIDLAHPKPGTHMLFQHNTATLIRVRQAAVIVRRLYNNRTELFKAETVCDLVRQPEAQPPIAHAQIFEIGHQIDEQIVLDFQTFLVFAGVALDEWAHCAAYTLGTPKPVKTSFEIIAKDNGEGPFSEIWGTHKEEILWLDTFIRLFRNKFFVHRERPWQFSYGHLVHSLEWSFWSPLSSGWLSEERKGEVDATISNLAHKLGIEIYGEMHRNIFQVLQKTANLEREDRKIIRCIAAEVAFEMPTFQEIAHKFLDFLLNASGTLARLAKNRPERINLGSPPG